MPEVQKDLSEPLRNPSADKPRHPRNISMDGKFQEIMHMPYNLMFRMVITNGEMLLILRLNRSKNIKYSNIMARLSMRRTKSQMHPSSTRKLEYISCLMSNIVGNSRQDLWQMDTSPKNPMKLSIQELLFEEHQIGNVSC